MQFGSALAAQPLPPAQFTLFFVEGKDEFTDESKRIVDGVFAEIAKRPVPDVIVIGHTDSVGSDAANDALVAPARRGRAGARSIARGVAADKVVSRSDAASASWPCPPATASPSRAIGASRSWFAEIASA